jgi:hypothetical protein
VFTLPSVSCGMFYWLAAKSRKLFDNVNQRARGSHLLFSYCAITLLSRLRTLADLVLDLTSGATQRRHLFLRSKQANCISSFPCPAGHSRMAKLTQTLPETRIRLFRPQTSQPQASPAACPSPPSVGKRVFPRIHVGFLPKSRE